MGFIAMTMSEWTHGPAIHSSYSPGRSSGGNSRLTNLSIMSKLDIMQIVSATDAKQRLAALLDAAQRGPVLIQRQKRDVAVIMAAEEYERMRDLAAADFQRFCDRVAAQAKARGLTPSVLRKLLKD